MGKRGLPSGEGTTGYLSQKLGAYMYSRDAAKRLNISGRILTKWREEGKLRSELLGGRWYYSAKVIAEAITTADIKDLKELHVKDGPRPFLDFRR